MSVSRDWELASWIATIVAAALSVVAIAVAIWAARKANRAAEQANNLQGQLVEIEGARERDRLRSSNSAYLTAELSRSPNSARLRIINRGQALARNIVVVVDDTEISQHPLVRADDVVEMLGPGASADYSFIRYDGMPRMYTVVLHWDDDTGEGRVWASELTLGDY